MNITKRNGRSYFPGGTKPPCSCCPLDTTVLTYGWEGRLGSSSWNHFGHFPIVHDALEVYHQVLSAVRLWFHCAKECLGTQKQSPKQSARIKLLKHTNNINTQKELRCVEESCLRVKNEKKKKTQPYPFSVSNARCLNTAFALTGVTPQPFSP